MLKNNVLGESQKIERSRPNGNRESSPQCLLKYSKALETAILRHRNPAAEISAKPPRPRHFTPKIKKRQGEILDAVILKNGRDGETRTRDL